MRNVKIILIGVGILACSAANAEGWSYGIGTGLQALDVDGDGGFNTQLLGPVDFDASLAADEFREYTESAFGFGGFAKKGSLTISYSIGRLELEEGVSAIQGVNTGAIDLTFTTVAAEVLANYTVSQSGENTWGVIGGIRYTAQEYEAVLTVNNAQTFDGSVDDSWTDVVLGLSHSYAISPTLSWSSQVDFSTGDSEGVTHFNTGINKVYGQNWLVRGAIDFKDIEYEEGNRGDGDWYLYDADETTIGVSFLYLF
jgi:hypothetical protein